VNAGIYLLKGNDQLVRMDERPYDSEDLLQEFPSFVVWTYGSVEIYFQHLKNRPIFRSEAKRLELLHRLNSIPGVSISEHALTKRPNFSLELLRDKKSLNLFFAAFDWLIQQIQNEPKIEQ